MHTITLYKPGKNGIDVEVPFASEWDELLPAELELVAALMQSDIQDDVKKRTILFNGFMQLRGRWHKLKVPNNIKDLVDPEEVVLNIFPLLNWLFDSNRLTRQPYPTIPLPGLRSTTVHGPQNDFDNVTVGEYEDAENFFFDFIETGSTVALAHMAAILYRPKNTPYLRIVNSATIPYKHEKRVANFARLPKQQLLAIWLWFTGCRNMITLYFPEAFASDPDGKPGKADRLSFTKTIHAAAGPKNGTRQAVRMLPIKEFFFDLNEEVKTIKAIKKQYQNGK